MKEITFLLTRHCNWNCRYCSIRNSQPECSEQELLKAFKAVLQNYRQENHLIINLSGGEPGLLSRKLMYQLLIAITNMAYSVHLNIFTNGKAFWIEDMLKRNARQFLPVIGSYKFIWHCTSDITVARRVRIPRKMRGGVMLSAVVTKENLDHLDRFLAVNKGLYIFFAAHNHYNQQDKLGLNSEDITRMMSILKQHYQSFALRSLEIPSFIMKEGNPTLQEHREYCSANLPEIHHVYDISKGKTQRVKCCVALSGSSAVPDCSKCVNHQQFYENALGSYGYTEPLILTN